MGTLETIPPSQPPRAVRPDAIERQMKRLAAQGGHMAGLAHVCAFVLIVLFSLGSLVSLSGEALASILRQWQSGGALNIPAAISVAVSTLLVLAMDVSMVYAASVLRMLTARRADASEKRTHQAVMAGVAILEAATYAYMSALYDHPASLAAWALILARAGAAPFPAVYLSMARPLPIERRDILHAAALAAGAGVLRDVTQLANDASAPLAKKVRLYQAADYQPGQADEQLDRMIAVLADAPIEPPGTPPASPVGDAITQATPSDAPESAPTSPQDGAGALLAFPARDASADDLATASTIVGPSVSIPAGRIEWTEATTGAASTTMPAPPRRRHAAKSAKGVRTSTRRASSNHPNPSGESREADARAAWDAGHRSVSALMANAPGAPMGRSTASKWVRTFTAREQ